MLARAERRLLLLVTLPLAAAFPVFASCADAEDSRAIDGDASVAIPGLEDVDAEIPIDAAPDGGCDAAEPSCVSVPLTCEEAPWCSVPTTVSTRFLLTSVWGSGPNDVWAVGSGGSILHWDGTAWKPVATAVKDTFRAVWGSGPNDVWTVSMTDAVFHSSGFENGTAEWVRVPPAADVAYTTAALCLWGSSTGELRIGARATFVDMGEEGFDIVNQFTLKRDRDGGIAWNPLRGTGSIFGIWGSSTDLWLVADNSEFNSAERGQILHGTGAVGGPLEWTRKDSQSIARLEGIWGSSGDDLWAVGEKGTLRRRTKGADAFQIVQSPTTQALHAVWGTAADDVWAVGDAGTILHFDGATWTPSLAAFALGSKPDLRSVWGSSKNDVWIVGDNVSLHYTGPKPGRQGGGQ